MGLGEGVRNLLVPSKTVFEGLSGAAQIPGASMLLILILVLAALLVLRLASRGLLFGALVGAWVAGGFFSLMLLRSRDMMFSDRYIPSGAAIIALCLVADFLWSRWGPRSSRLGAVPALCVVGYLGVHAVFAHLSTFQCVSEGTFFVTMAEEYPTSYYPRLLLAEMMFTRGQDVDGAVAYVREALTLAPRELRVRALAIAITKRFIEAGDYRRGLDALAWSVDGLPETAGIWDLRARCEAGLKNFPAALNSMQKATALAPGRADYRKRLEEISAAAAAAH